MSEQNEKKKADDSEAETTIVNTASVAAAGQKGGRGQARKSADPTPLIPEPAQRSKSPKGEGASPRTPAQSGQKKGEQERPASSMRQKAQSFAHTLGDLVGLSDEQEGQDPGQPLGAAEESGESRGEGPAAPLSGKHPEFSNAFDIIDQMEGELEDAHQVLFHSAQVRIDQQAMLDHLSELRDVLPVQLERASALMREAEQRRQEASARSEKIVRGARDEKDRILEKAHHRADVLAGQENVVALARRKAQAILKDANARADSLTRGADDYARQVLTKLSTQLSDFAKQTQGGVAVLRQREQQAAQKFENTRDRALHGPAQGRGQGEGREK